MDFHGFSLPFTEEYDPLTDQGVHLNFWDGRRVVEKVKNLMNRFSHPFIVKELGVCGYIFCLFVYGVYVRVEDFQEYDMFWWSYP